MHTDAVPEKFDRTEYAPFDYQIGQKFLRDIWENGEFVGSSATGETYFVPLKGTPIKVEGDLNKFIDEVQSRGNQNKLERLLREGKITPMVRTRRYTGNSAILEIALVKDSDWRVFTPFEAYVPLVDLYNKTTTIVSAKYSGGSNGFFENITETDRPHLKFVQLPQGIVEVAQPQHIVDSQTFKPLDRALIPFIRENCYRPS